MKENKLANYIDYCKNNIDIKLFIIGAIVGIIIPIGFGGLNSGDNLDENTQSIQVTLGTITNSIKVLGQAELVDEQELRFNQQGEVKAVYVNAGDEVKAGDLIAELDKESVENEIQQAEISLYNAKISLQEVLNGNEDYQIMKAENDVTNSEKKIDIAQQEYYNLELEMDNTINNKEKYVIDSQKNYNKDLENALLNIKNSIIDGQDILIDLDNILGVTDKYRNKNDDFESYLGVKDSSIKIQASTYINDGYSNIEKLLIYYNSIKSTTDINSIIKGLNQSKETFEVLLDASNYTYQTLENSVTTSDFSDNDLNSLKNTVSNDRTSASNIINLFINTENQLETANNMEYTQKEYQETIDDYELRIKNQEVEIENLKDILEYQKEVLQDTKSGSSATQIQKAQNDVTQKELALEQKKNNLDSLELTAPFDGVIRKIDFKVGDNLVSDEKKYVYLENPNLIEVSILLDQIDVVNVKKGQKAIIEFDAYPGEEIEGILGEIDSTPIESSGVISYEVKISINKGNRIIYSGMTANVKIIVEEANNIISIPKIYLTTNNEINTVNVKNKQNKIINTPVEIGIDDDVNIEIISGLTVGDYIISNQSFEISTTKSQTNQGGGIPMMGMGGGMGGDRRGR